MDIRMPQLGESVTEGTLGKWLVQPGEAVKKYQPIAEVITDKVNAEIPAPADGVVTGLVISEGTTVKVGALIATMQGAEAPAPVVGSGPMATGGTAATAPTVAPVAALARPAALAGAATAQLVDRPRGEAAGRYSPAVLRLAQEHGVDLARLTGSGLGGRITRKDVEACIAAGPAGVAETCMAGQVAAQIAAPAPAVGTGPAAPPAELHVPAPAPAPGLTPAPAPAPALATGDQVIPVDAVRRRIAEKMLQSKHEAPHAWTMIQVDVTGLVKLREQVGEEFKRREGVSLSYVPFFIKAVVESLKEFPLLNSQWAGDQIVIKKEMNISVAVATETALAVPVVKNADRLSIAGLNQTVAGLAAKARAGRLTLDDISGGTFTVNNTGYFGSVMSAPIINYPQAAILSFEAITKTPVVLENDAIAIRSMMNLCLSLDHRILDGLVCGRFLQAVKNRLQGYGPGNVTLY